MKKTFFCLLICSLTLYTHAQFFEHSGYLSSDGNAFGHSFLSAGETSVDYKGNIFHKFTDHPCLPCTHETSIGKRGVNGNNWGFSLGQFGEANAFEDQMGNTYMRWIDKDGVLTYNGISYDVTGGYPDALFKFNQSSVIQWVIDFEPGTVFTDTSENLFLLNSSKLLRKYSSSGILLDSVQYNSSTVPAFMDSLGGFYRYRNDTLTKFEFNGTVIWQKRFASSRVDYSKQGPFIFVYNSSIIRLVDLNGNVTTHHNASGRCCSLQFDLNGNYFYQSGSSLSKYKITSGLVYSTTIPIVSPSVMDRNGKFYAWGYYSTYSQTGNTVHNIFIPPSIYTNHIPYDQGGSFGEFFNWYTIINTDETDREITFNMPSSLSFCTENSKNMYFTVNKYPFDCFQNGFDVELESPTRGPNMTYHIGNGNHSPMTIRLDDSIPPNTQYKLIITPRDTSFTSTNNTLRNVKVHTNPDAQILYSNCIKRNNQYERLYGCDSIFFHTPSNPYYATYTWQKETLDHGHYPPVLYQTKSTDSIYWFKEPYCDYVSLYITDSAGCYDRDSIGAELFSPSTTFSLSLVDTINIGYGPVYMSSSLQNYRIDTLYGNAITNGNYYGQYIFNPDIAGAGMHYVYAKLFNQNIYEPFNCFPDSIIDSIYVSTTPYAHLSLSGPQYICTGDSSEITISLYGTPPFSFWLSKQDTTTTVFGPYTTNQNTYTLQVAPTGYTYYRIDSFADASGGYVNAWNGYTNVQVVNFTPPAITTFESTTFCAGDSVKLIRDSVYSYYYFHYQWKLNGNDLPGDTATEYYAKAQGDYTVACTLNSVGCIEVSNTISTTVPCFTTNEGGLWASVERQGLPEEDRFDFIKDENKLYFTFIQKTNIQSVELFDISGRELFATTFFLNDQNSLEVILPPLSAGTYFVLLHSATGTIRKLFLENKW